MGHSKLEYPPCEICSGRKTNRLFNIGKYSIVKCQKCGLVYTTPRPSESEMVKHYTKEKRKTLPALRPHAVRQIFREMWHAYKGAVSRKDPLLLEDYAAGKVLDVGCGFGELLRNLKKKGWQTYGIEINREAAKHAQEFGKIFMNQLQKIKFPNRFFDAVILRHALEHVYHPSKLLGEIHRILKEDCPLAIEVPNVDSMEARIFKTRWPLWNPPEHLYHFSRGTLELLLRKTGFRIVRVSNSPSPIGILGSLDKLMGTSCKIDNPIFNALLYPFASFISKMTPTYALRVIAQKS